MLNKELIVLLPKSEGNSGHNAIANLLITITYANIFRPQLLVFFIMFEKKFLLPGPIKPF